MARLPKAIRDKLAIRDPLARAEALEAALADAPVPEELIEPWVDALGESPMDQPAMGVRVAKVCERFASRVRFLQIAGEQLDDWNCDDGAIEVLRRAIAAGADSAATFGRLGERLCVRGEEEGADLLARAIERSPQWPSYRIALALWHVRTDPAQALAVLEPVLAAPGSDGLHIHEVHSMVLEALGRAGEAAAARARALEAAADALDARCTLARWHFDQDRYERSLLHARSLFEVRRALSLDRAYACVDVDLLDRRILQGYRLGGAFAEILPWVRERCARALPSSLAFDVYYGLCSSTPCLDLELARRAARVAAAGAKRDGDDAEVRTWLIREAGLVAKHGGGLGMLDELAATGLGDDATAWAELAGCYHARRAADAARAALDRAGAIEPRNPDVLSEQFDVAFDAGDLEAAQRAADALLAVAPERHHGHELQGRLCVRRGDADGALAHSARALGIAPYCHLAWIGRAEALLIAGDRDGAQRAAERSLQIDAGEPGNDAQVIRAAAAADLAALDRALAARAADGDPYPFPSFVARLRAGARRGVT